MTEGNGLIKSSFFPNVTFDVIMCINGTKNSVSLWDYLSHNGLVTTFVHDGQSLINRVRIYSEPHEKTAGVTSHKNPSVAVVVFDPTIKLKKNPGHIEDYDNLSLFLGLDNGFYGGIYSVMRMKTFREGIKYVALCKDEGLGKKIRDKEFVDAYLTYDLVSRLPEVIKSLKPQ